MSHLDQNINKQLKEACRYSSASWAIWLVHNADRWSPVLPVTGSRKIQANVAQFLSTSEITAWLNQTLLNGRTSWCNLNNVVKNRKTALDNLYAFPSETGHTILLVSARKLDPENKRIFKILSITSPISTSVFSGLVKNTMSVDSEITAASLVDSINEIPELKTGITLENILKHIASSIACENAFFAVRRGQAIRIQINLPSKPVFQGLDIPINETPILKSIFNDQEPRLLNEKNLTQQYEIAGILPKDTKAWIVIPVIKGHRIIGLFSLASTKKDAFSFENYIFLSNHVNRISNIIEHAILFEEAARYLQQLALMNELTAIASSEIDIDSVAKRVMQRLRRFFKTDWAATFLLSTDHNTLREYGGKLQNGTPWILQVNDSITGRAVISGLPVRINLLNEEFTKILPITEESSTKLRSELSVPLKYHGQIIGVLSLRSSVLNAFSLQDEQLLTLISSHLAGAFVNMRLNRETQERAKLLSNTVRQLEAARETALDITSDLDLDTLLYRIVQRARDLVGGRGAELRLVENQEGYNPFEKLKTAVSEFPWVVSDEDRRIGIDFSDKIISSSQPLVNNKLLESSINSITISSPRYRAVVGVPLTHRGEIIGTLIVMDDRFEKQFTQTDINLLELLTTQAAISIRNAQLYAQTQLYLRKVKESQKALIQAEKMATSGRLMASIAHEINNPLQALQNCLHLVGRPELSSDVREGYLNLAQEELIRLMNIMQRMLDFYRPGSLDKKPTDIHALLNKTLQFAQKQLEDSNISLSLDLFQDEPYTLAVPDQLQQVFLNLILNAGQAMSQGGKLTIQTSQYQGPNGQILVEILFKDSGPGIPPDLRDRIFDPFFSSRDSGLGLGLAVSYGIISAHDGILELIDQPNSGACFRVLLNGISTGLKE